MQGVVKIVIDSVLDPEQVRVLISSKENKEEDYVITKRSLARLLGRKVLDKHPEGQVFLIDAQWSTIMGQLQGPDASGIKAHGVKVPPRVVPRARDVTKAERARVHAIHLRLRDRGGGKQE